ADALVRPTALAEDLDQGEEFIRRHQRPVHSFYEYLLLPGTIGRAAGGGVREHEVAEFISQVGQLVGPPLQELGARRQFERQAAAFGQPAEAIPLPVGCGAGELVANASREDAALLIEQRADGTEVPGEP